MSARTSTARNIWIAAWLLAHDLRLARATRSPGPAFRVIFTFHDPEGTAPRLIAAYRANRQLHRLIGSRRLMGEALDVVAIAAIATRKGLGWESWQQMPQNRADDRSGRQRARRLTYADPPPYRAPWTAVAFC